MRRLGLKVADGQEGIWLEALGGGSGHAVLLVPGMFSDQRFFVGTRAGVGLAHHLGSSRPVYVLRRRSDGHWNDWIHYDLTAAIHTALSDSNRQKLFLVGHSAGAGAAACLALLPQHRPLLAGLGLLSVPHPKTRGLRRTLGLMAGIGLTHAFGRFPAKLLGLSDLDEGKHLFLPWMYWHLRGKFDSYLDLAPLSPEIPVYSAVGTDDILWAPVRGAERLHRTMDGGNALSEFCVFPGSHPGVVTGKSARDNLWPSLASWMKRVDDEVGGK